MVFTLPLSSQLKYAFLLPFHHQNLGGKSGFGGEKEGRREKGKSVLESGAHHKFMKPSECCQRQTFM